MTRKMRVYGAYLGLRGVRGQVRAIVAATSGREAATHMGVTYQDYAHNGCETGNDHEIELAMAEPGVVFYAPLKGDGRRSYQRWEAEG